MEGQRLPPPSADSPSAVRRHDPKEQGRGSVRSVAAPLDDARGLSTLLVNVASLVRAAAHSQKAAQLTHRCLTGALTQASDAMNSSRVVFQATWQLGQHLLNQQGQAGSKEMFRSLPDLRLSYETLQRVLNKTEDALCHPEEQIHTMHTRECSPSTMGGHPENGNNLVREQTVTEKTTHHKQLDAVRTEEHMGGAYVTQRRRSPLRSTSSCTNGLSPLLSEELNSTKPIAKSPNCKGSSYVTNKVIHRERCQHSVSDTEEPLVLTPNVRPVPPP
ncbi:uncharacterized protein LOC142098600 [Mixophyes fleayi]|uniref:uncharacterized protein LOC142098600 n=1 Tax=Mixophyes fleayi TaxID=3061075 RepID=UPI003F4E08C6